MKNSKKVETNEKLILYFSKQKNVTNYTSVDQVIVKIMKTKVLREDKVRIKFICSVLTCVIQCHTKTTM